MRSFKEYLTESVKKYNFKIKVAHECNTASEAKLKGLLERFSVSEFKKLGKTPIQELPLDFPTLRNQEVHIYEVSLGYPTTPQELTEYISSNMGISAQRLVVRNPGEPGEEYQTPVEKREGALLDDSEYKESTNANHDDYYGEAYNTKFLKGISDELKQQRKARGEQIPSGE
jgi:hypothetical protein